MTAREHPSGAQAPAVHLVPDPLGEDARDDLIDLLPKNMLLWADDDELDWWQEDPWTYTKWRRVLDHEPAHRGCCSKCGCCTMCMFSAFHDAVVSSVVRELDKLGCLRARVEPSDV